LPFASTDPQEFGQEDPATLQRTEVSGFPLLVTVARKDCVAPSSTLEELAETETAMSLETVTLAVADLEESAWLVAVTCTVPPEGRPVGAI